MYDRGEYGFLFSVSPRKTASNREEEPVLLSGRALILKGDE